MAPPPLPANSTPRIFIDYTAMGVPHTVMLRVNAFPESIATWVGALTGPMLLAMRNDDTITGLRTAVQGSDITVPAPWTGLAGALANGAIADDPESVFFSVPFRDVLEGRKGRYDFYLPSTVLPLDTNNRVPRGENTYLDAIHIGIFDLTFAGGADPYLVTIGGSPILPNQYANRAKSGYWQREQRRRG